MDSLAARIARILNSSVEHCAQVKGGGYTPAIRLLCTTNRGRFFVKAGSTPNTNEWIRREIHAYHALAGHGFLPQLIGWEMGEADDAPPILILEDLSAYHWPPPWERRDVERVLDQIHAMHAITDAPVGPYETSLDGIPPGWSVVAEDPEPFLSLGMADEHWLRAALPVLTDAEANCRTEGDSLCHWDLRSDNLCWSDSRVLFVDWNFACRANPTLDLGAWLPSLAHESGILPDTILPDAPEVAAWVSGFFAARAGLPKIEQAPRVRYIQRVQLETALPWAVRALGLPPLP